ncbi:ribonuclease P protein component [Flavimarina sp. Hel_I_48]|uniref:ribonuclease P protein component n=1 Tax=Flavimarina sp. Hel_I_48 TaxID=1392488 RepID=UPI0004DF3174|nr:ribonuclease P protein component [Flavimarina sp. Hel_I_48]
MNEQFPKPEKLKRDKLIEQLFKSGKSAKAFPLVLIYGQAILPEKVPIQAGFSVPKRNHKLAVTRNRLKRITRETYRKNKTLFEVGEQTYTFMFIYVGKEKMNYAQINRSMEKLIAKFNTEVKKEQESSPD